MSLEELNEKLHSRDAHLDRTRPRSAFEPGSPTGSPETQVAFQRTETWRDAPSVPPASAQALLFSDISKRKRRRQIAWAVGGMAALALLGGLTYQVRTSLFSQERVKLSITGPQDVASAETVTFTVTYANQNWAGLENATLILTYPESFYPDSAAQGRSESAVEEISLGTLDANSEGKFTVTGKFYGSKGSRVAMQAVLRYTPKGVSMVYEVEAYSNVNLASSPLSLEITAPLELATGQEVEYVIDYSNESNLPFSNLRVKVEYPEGFRFVTAEPRPSEGESVWYVGDLTPQSRGKIVIRGVLTGARDEQKRVRGMIGFFQGDGQFVAYAENERGMRIVASPFRITQTVNGVTEGTAYPGEMLNYVIRYENESALGMRDVIVTVELDPTFLDMARLTLPLGAYDAARQTITWKASEIPALRSLAPGARGELTFSVPVLGALPVGSVKNPSIRSTAKIDSPDLPTVLGSNKIIGSNLLVVKIGALATLTAKALYADAVFPNSGPFPPKVGQETSYTIQVALSNTSNDLKDARISVLLPTGVAYRGKFSPAGEAVTFNERTNELVWELGTLSPTQGSLRTLAFQVQATPAPNNAGQPLLLVNNIIFTGQDTYTGQMLRKEVGTINTNLREDTAYASVSGNVQRAE